jgi:hypothetical protein
MWRAEVNGIRIPCRSYRLSGIISKQWQHQQHQQINPPIETTSPSSLRSFDYPRKTKKMIQNNDNFNSNLNPNKNIDPNVNINVLSNSTNTNNASNNSSSANTFPRRNNIAEFNEYTYPAKIDNQLPFRN